MSNVSHTIASNLWTVALCASVCFASKGPARDTVIQDGSGWARVHIISDTLRYGTLHRFEGDTQVLYRGGFDASNKIGGQAHLFVSFSDSSYSFGEGLIRDNRIDGYGRILTQDAYLVGRLADSQIDSGLVVSRDGRISQGLFRDGGLQTGRILLPDGSILYVDSTRGDLRYGNRWTRKGWMESGIFLQDRLVSGMTKLSEGEVTRRKNPLLDSALVDLRVVPDGWSLVERKSGRPLVRQVRDLKVQPRRVSRDLYRSLVDSVQDSGYSPCWEKRPAKLSFLSDDQSCLLPEEAARFCRHLGMRLPTLGEWRWISEFGAREESGRSRLARSERDDRLGVSGFGYGKEWILADSGGSPVAGAQFGEEPRGAAGRSPEIGFRCVEAPPLDSLAVLPYLDARTSSGEVRIEESGGFVVRMPTQAGVPTSLSWSAIPSGSMKELGNPWCREIACDKGMDGCAVACHRLLVWEGKSGELQLNRTKAGERERALGTWKVSVSGRLQP